MDLINRTLILSASLVFILNTIQPNHAREENKDRDNYPSGSINPAQNEPDLSVQNEDYLKDLVASKTDQYYANNDTRLSTPSTLSMATILSPEEFVKPDFCIATPQNMSFCSTKLAWAPTMAMPNLLGHKSEDELNAFLSLYPFQEMANVKCKASHQLKLLLCSVVAPVCLDASSIPCRQLCVTVRSSCEPAIKRQGLEWPKFLDCRRFPRKNQNDNCIERQPMLISTGSSQIAACVHNRNELYMTNLTKSNVKRKRKEKKNRTMVISLGKTTLPSSSSSSTNATNTDSTTINSSATPEFFLAKENNGTSINATTPAIKFDSMITSSLGIQPSSTLENTTTASTTTTTVPLSSTSTEYLITTAPSVAPISNTVNLLETKTQGNDNETTTMNLNVPTLDENSFRQDYVSMPVNVTNDLTQLLCSTSPDWLIKTKLSDGQLINAVTKRKLKVRSYLQIFGGNLATKDGAISTTAQPLSSEKSIRSNLHLELSNATVFVAPLGADLYTQPISRASESNQDSAQLKKTVRYYLIAGTGANDSTKLTSIFILWPSGKVTMSSDSQGSVNIIKTYREFKHKGLRVCNHQNRRYHGQVQQQPATNSRNDLNGNTSRKLSSGFRENQNPSRYRRNKKKKEVQTIMSE